MELPKITVRPDSLPSLLNGIRAGQIQVPRFQRDFVWPISKTRKLLDSMYKEFPIGSFFLWNAPADAPSLSRPLPELEIPAPQPGSPVIYILDGQQRLTSLYCVIYGIRFGNRDYGKISLDLKVATEYLNSPNEDFNSDIFVYRLGDNNRFIAIKDLTGINHLNIFNQVPDEWKSAFNKASNLFTIYPFSVVSIQDQLLGNAIEIFQRINQSGKPLSRFDLVCANVWTEEFDFRKKVNEVNRTFESKGFGIIDETIYTQIFALIVFEQCTTAAELTLKTEDIQSKWAIAIKSLGLAVDYLVHNMGVVRVDYLPYRGLLAVLAYFFYISGGNITVTDREILWKWFWRTTLSERYSSTSPTRMAEDAGKLKRHLSNEPVAFNYAYSLTSEPILRTKMSSTSSALRNATLCLLAIKEPRNFKDNSVVNLRDNFFTILKQAERHHIFPVGYLRTKIIDTSKVHLLANFCFIPASLNKEIGSRAPSDYMSGYKQQNPQFESALSSHLIPNQDDSGLWNDDFNKFLLVRSQTIADALNEIVESGPSDLLQNLLVYSDSRVDVLEINLRDFIDHRLLGIVGVSYWKDVVPSDIDESVKERIVDHISRHPYESLSDFASGRVKLDFCDVAHYQKIILKNWGLFQEYFLRKEEVTTHLNAFRNLRNCIKHNRLPTDIEKINGDAAILWLGRVVETYQREKSELENATGDEIEFEESN